MTMTTKTGSRTVRTMMGGEDGKYAIDRGENGKDAINRGEDGKDDGGGKDRKDNGGGRMPLTGRSTPVTGGSTRPIGTRIQQW